MVPIDILLKISNDLGFDACGVSKALHLPDDAARVKEWLDNGMHGEMGYMERNFEKRTDPTILVPNAKSVVSVLVNYFPGNPNVSKELPRISRYALSTDYHKVVKDMLYKFFDKLRENFGPIEGRAFVDSAPVLERTWAVKAGLGWIGKSGMLIHPKFGTYTFIGQLIIDLEIEPSNDTVPNRCGTCTRCMDACPTGAIIAPAKVDAQKCISYLTIEKKTPLAESEQKKLSGWCFGCDICQEVCPWNSKVTPASILELHPKLGISGLNPTGILELSKPDFQHLFGETPVARASYERFIANCKIAATNKTKPE